MRVALSGRIASGKSTVADLLCDLIGAKRVSCAAPMKTILQALRDGDERAFAQEILALSDDPRVQRALAVGTLELANKHVADIQSQGKPRLFLQQLGDLGRALDPNIWIDRFLNDSAAGSLVCDDLRFPNEVERLRAVGWYLVRCECDEEIRLGRVHAIYGTLEGDDAVNERSLDDWADWDYVLDTGILLDWQREAVRQMHEYLGTQVRPLVT